MQAVLTVCENFITYVRRFNYTCVQLVEKWYYEWKTNIPVKNAKMVEMPNHFYCILEIVEATNPVLFKRAWFRLCQYLPQEIVQ